MDWILGLMTKYAADYGKRVANCKKCKQKIDKGIMRLAKLTTNPFSEEGGDMKLYHHPQCLFDTFLRARATTRKIEDTEDVEGFKDLKQEDKDEINKLIKDSLEKSSNKKTTPAKKKATPKKAAVTPMKSETIPSATNGASASPKPVATVTSTDTNASHKDNSFRQFRCVCAEIAEEASYNGKTAIVKKFLTKGSDGDSYKGDCYLMLKLLLPGVVKRVYNLNSKQMIKLFSQIFHTNQEEMLTHLEQGDVAETIKTFFDDNTALPPQKKSNLDIIEVDNFLTEMSKLTKEDEQQRCLTKITKRCTGNDLRMVIRLIKHDLRINAGAKHILEGLDPNAYPAFQASRDLRDVVDRVLANKKEAAEGGKPGMTKKLSVRANLMTPVLPMLAEACKSVEYAMKKCPNGMYAEIKYDGERVQVHKQGDSFHYFSRSLKPVLPHKVQHFKDYIPKAFPGGSDLILDAEVLLVDTNTSQPLPFGTLGVHKKAAFQDAKVCLYIFDCLHYNGENMMDKPIKERRRILHKNMVEVPHRVLFSEMKHIHKPIDLKDLMMKVFREGLEGLVLKDVNGIYEPGKRHWLKVKKDYLADGAMADTADLVVLGAYYGTGNKGGIMSVFLMGVYDPDKDIWRTVSKVAGGHDDKTLDRLQKELEMVKIKKDASRIPSWLRINKNVLPDFVVADPKKAPVWEITGAEFSKSESHTADGISIRFPRVTKIRDDKGWKEATDLPRLRELFKVSKQHSEIPDMIGASTPKKAETNGSGSSNGSRPTTPIKTEKSSSPRPSTPVRAEKRKLEEASESASPAKRKPVDSPSKGNPVCKYGSDCYQTNPAHREQYTHTVSSQPTKKLPTVFKGMKIYLPSSVEKYKELKRYIVAFDGDIVAEFEKDTATHTVQSSDEGDSSSATTITTDWLWRCIKKKQIVPV
ncbi:unnamed protein product [Owenia fusiformis]|uniref:DNA ligase n=1 Tax=Owenia fusiformis TaxID=6347 RepID=A0A8S4N3L0_OWEFU|nr:unnamed protein product [Owenia fusiformis]